jgi:diadenosine tetraphosphate (Ap4A) HIT family hydrolase
VKVRLHRARKKLKALLEERCTFDVDIASLKSFVKAQGHIEHEGLDAIFELLWQAKHFLDEKFNPVAYNTYVDGTAPAGQTIMHVPAHFVLAYRDHVDDPNGDVRGDIPAQQKYPSRCV